jgi:hypothetical protein
MQISFVHNNVSAYRISSKFLLSFIFHVLLHLVRERREKLLREITREFERQEKLHISCEAFHKHSRSFEVLLSCFFFHFHILSIFNPCLCELSRIFSLSFSHRILVIFLKWKFQFHFVLWRKMFLSKNIIFVRCKIFWNFT